MSKWMVCPDCKRRINIIDSIYMSSNNIPMIKIKCECNLYQILTISLEYFLNQLKIASFNNIKCKQHKNIEECSKFCLNCQQWLCRNCEEDHNKEHIQCNSQNIHILTCKEHHNNISFFCVVCNEELCNECQTNHKAHNLVNLTNFWNETYNKLKFKNLKEVNEFLTGLRENHEKYKREKIEYINKLINKLEKVKYEIEKNYEDMKKNNNYLSEVILIAFDNFFRVKNIPNYSVIKNVNVLNFNISENNLNSNRKKDKNEEDYLELLLKEIKESKEIFFKENSLYKKNISISSSANIHNLPINNSSIQLSKKSSIFTIKYNPMKTIFLKCKATLKSHLSAIYDIIELSNGNIASCSSDNTIKIWSISSNRCIGTLQGHTGIVYKICQLTDSRIASCSEDSTIRIWSLGTLSFDIELLGHEESVYSVIQLIDGNLASGSYDQTIKIWSITNKICLMTLKGHIKSIYRVIEIEKNLLVSSSYDNTIKIWKIDIDKQEGKCLTTLIDHSSYVWDIKEIIDRKYQNKLIASGSTDSTIRVWDVKEGKCLYKLTGHTFTVISIAQLNNGDLVSASYDNTIKVWDLCSKICKLTIYGHSSAVWTLCLLKNGNLVSGSWDKTLKIWE